MLQSIVALVQAGYGTETYLPLRSLYETAANQCYMAADEARAIQFAVEELYSRKRLLLTMTDFDLADPGARAELAKAVEEERNDMLDAEPEIVATVDEKEFWPFGMGIGRRVQDAPAWLRDYYSVYRVLYTAPSCRGRLWTGFVDVEGHSGRVMAMPIEPVCP